MWKRWQVGHLVLTLATVFAVPRSAAAQSLADSLTADTPATSAQIRALLSSSDTREQAWGGWFAAREKTPELTPVLERVVSQQLSSGQPPNDAAMDAALDALIQTDARLLPAWLVTVFPRRPTQALILLSRLGPEADNALLQVAEKQGGLAWFAAANLLLSHHAAGFGALLLRDFQIKVSIQVLDPGQPRIGHESSGTPGPAQDRVAPISGFPPLPRYRLLSTAGPDAFILSAGPTPVSYRREVFPTEGWSTWEARAYQLGPTMVDRLRYVAAAAPKSSMIKQLENRWIFWTGSDAFDAEVASNLQEIHERYNKVLQEMAAGGYLTTDEVTKFAATKLDIQLSDLRAVQTPPLRIPQ